MLKKNRATNAAQMPIGVAMALDEREPQLGLPTNPRLAPRIGSTRSARISLLPPKLEGSLGIVAPAVNPYEEDAHAEFPRALVGENRRRLAGSDPGRRRLVGHPDGVPDSGPNSRKTVVSG